jgi:hypothetical protein
MAVWTQSFGILDGVFAAARERDTMVNLKIWGAVRPANKWCLLATGCTPSFGLDLTRFHGRVVF